MENSFSRRDLLKGGGASLAMMGISKAVAQQTAPQNAGPLQDATTEKQDATRAQRMEWWHAARFGMFIHFGVYSTFERHEWVMENEAIPIGQYTAHAPNFHPAPNCPRAWARLAKRAGMKYMVMTTKHHEGFCNFDTKLTNYCAPKACAWGSITRSWTGIIPTERDARLTRRRGGGSSITRTA